MVAEGIEFQTGVHVGRDKSIRELVSFNDAVVLCVGSTWPRDLKIPGWFFFLQFIDFVNINLIIVAMFVHYLNYS